MATLAKKAKQALKDKPTQHDLRRLMREKQASKANDKKIDSPLAKYNNVDQLICVLCNVHVKSEKLWLAHVNGRTHKDHLEELKKKKEDEGKFRKPAIPPSTANDKEKNNENNSAKPIDIAKTTVGTSELPADFFDGSSKNNNNKNPPTRDDSDSSSDSDGEKNPLKSTALPESNMPVTKNEQTKAESKDAIPEGFFDDPIVDAKVRKVEYKDPAEEEWEKFQREIANVTAKSQVLIDEEDTESKAERQIDEIDEQINNWARVDALQKKKEQLATCSNKNQDEDDENVNEQEFEELLNWRAKGVWR